MDDRAERQKIHDVDPRPEVVLGVCWDVEQADSDTSPARPRLRKWAADAGAANVLVAGMRIPATSTRSVPRTCRIVAEEYRPGGHADIERSSAQGDDPCGPTGLYRGRG